MKKLYSYSFALCLSSLLFSTSAHAIDLQKNPQIENYIQHISNRYNFDSAQLEKWFSATEFNKTKIPTTKPQQGAGISIKMPWYVYRDRIITPTRINSGIAFWQQNSGYLAATQNTYGVPASLIIGILGLETNYGKNQGTYSALGSLSTYAFRIPRRQEYFRDELTNYLLLCREQKWDPLRICSSVDGGLGMAQFMPSSYREFAIDADKKGRKNLFRSTHDAIASIGNYLKQKGWQTGQPVAMPAKVLSEDYEPLLEENAKLHFTVAELRKYGLAPVDPVPDDTRVGVAFLKFADHISPWLFFHNFAVIKSYNNSTNYALTVYTLGNIIQAQSSTPVAGNIAFSNGASVPTPAHAAKKRAAHTKHKHAQKGSAKKHSKQKNNKKVSSVSP